MKYILFALLLVGCASLNKNKDIDYSVNHDIIKKILRSSMDNQRACYEEYIQTAPEGKKKVSIVAVITLSNNGIVENVDFNKKLQSKLENCLKYALYSLRFPGSINRIERTIELKQPFNFMPNRP